MFSVFKWRLQLDVVTLITINLTRTLQTQSVQWMAKNPFMQDKSINFHLWNFVWKRGRSCSVVWSPMSALVFSLSKWFTWHQKWLFLSCTINIIFEPLLYFFPYKFGMTNLIKWKIRTWGHHLDRAVVDVWFVIDKIPCLVVELVVGFLGNHKLAVGG